MQPEWVTTSTILRDLREFGRQEAWAKLDGRFRRPIVSFAQRLGLDAVAAEDVAQETLLAFAEAYRSGQYDRDKGRLSQWLFGIAYRQALRQRRRQARAEVVVPPAQGEQSFWADLPDEAHATQTWDMQWELALLDECLRQIRMEVEPQTVAAFELVVLQHKTPAQAAEALDMPVKAVYNAKHRVLKRVRELRESLEDVR